MFSMKLSITSMLFSAFGTMVPFLLKILMKSLKVHMQFFLLMEFLRKFEKEQRIVNYRYWMRPVLWLQKFIEKLSAMPKKSTPLSSLDIITMLRLKGLLEKLPNIFL